MNQRALILIFIALLFLTPRPALAYTFECAGTDFGLVSEGYEPGNVALSNHGFLEPSGVSACGATSGGCPALPGGQTVSCSGACGQVSIDDEEEIITVYCYYGIWSGVNSCQEIGLVDGDTPGSCIEDPVNDDCNWPQNGLSYYEVDWPSCDVPNNGDDPAPDCNAATDPYGCQGQPTKDLCDSSTDPFGCAVPEPQFDEAPNDPTTDSPTSCPSGYSYNSGTQSCSQSGDEGTEGCSRGVYADPSTGGCNPDYDPFSQTDSSTTSGSSTTTQNPDGSSTTSYTETTEDDTPNQIGGGSCATLNPPSCSGDPVLCYIAQQNFRQTCALLQDGLAEAEAAVESDPLTDESLLDAGTIDVAGQIDDSGFLAGSCPAPVPVSTAIASFSIDLTFFCDLASYISVFLISFAFLWSGRIVVEAF